VPAARHFVRGALAGTPRADDMELIACELITNSIRHTPAGDQGGKVTITVRAGSGRSRVEVSDPGTGQWHPPADGQHGTGRPDAEYGRGLAIIATLADKLGHDATPEGQTLWAEVTWSGQEGDQ
jgi:anti-sigma regulatory factor (Ser/Thr protein kinase)